MVITGLNNVCACARSHCSQMGQRPGHHNKPRKNGGVFKKFRMVPDLWRKGRVTQKTVKGNLDTSSLDHWLAHTLLGFKHWGLKLVQLFKTARKHERFIEDLLDDLRVTPGFGLFLHPSYYSLGYMQSPASGLASLLNEHLLEKHDKVAWGGLTRPLLGSWTGI